MSILCYNFDYMCFSASASFTASAGLALIGTASLVVAKREDKMLAFVPLAFAVQQGLEGMQWIALGNGSPSFIAGYGFLFFAFMLWPIYVPTFVFVLDKPRQAFLRYFMYVGIAVAAYFLALLITQPVSISIANRCIDYHFANFPFRDLAVFSYILAIIAPFFLCDITAFKWFGYVIAATALIAWLFFTLTFTSVWCFFAAVVSSLFFIYLWNKRSLAKS